MSVPATPVSGSPPVAADPLLGTVIDRYKVVGRLGEGGMGTVYSVEHVMLQKRMAMKLLRTELSRNPELAVRFQNEAIAASKIGQENIVGVTDFGRTGDGRFYFVMEELSGHSLAEVVRAQGWLEMPRVLAIAGQVCRALNAAHSHGIIHRDLKPENIVLVPRDGQAELVKVLDFGISKMTHRDGARLTQVGMIVGTPEYMAPEQAADGAVDARSDIYSLGVAMFEMLTGRLPFEGETALQILTRAQTQPLPTLLQARPGGSFPPAIEALVSRALARKPEDRFQSMTEVLAEIQGCAAQLGFTVTPQPDPLDFTPSQPTAAIRSPSKPPAAVAPLVLRSTPATPEGAVVASQKYGTDELARAFAPRRRGMYAALAAALVAALGVGFALFRSAPTPPEEVAKPAVAVQPLPAPPVVVPPVAPPIQVPQSAPPEHLEARVTDAKLAVPAPRPPAVHRPAHPKPNDRSVESFQKVDDLKSAY